MRFNLREKYFALSPKVRLILVFLLVAVVLLLVSGVGAKLSRRIFSQKENRLLERYQEAVTRQRQAEQRAMEAAERAAGIEQDLALANARAEAAEKALITARSVTVQAKFDYEAIRNNNQFLNPATPAPGVDELCAKLADLGYPCAR